ncbi:oxidoreductase [Pontibacillus halophilus JSM 076056 = DSM 19796]|uniref:Oxidoreductase n=1 Tax=Pontibacillus halophilus JSM 076056 = DSM 19796 TaxID=1385510 RepID=A0A0A5GEI1_9BACI|nr:formate dehydrogenase subunit alpha [Pontibacillus halophilus]KGX91626.1 oxidoreductase [Pontibacillus halophilus JSM 076056 = DSM 19796]
MKDQEHNVVTINGQEFLAKPGQLLIDTINEAKEQVPQICYHHSLGPVQTCDTCIVRVNGELTRACGIEVKPGMDVQTEAEDVNQAQYEALNRIMGKHELYCTVCDYNNGSCEIHNAIAEWGIEHQSKPFRPSSYEVDRSGSFYRYDPDQCILCGRCVEVCQDVQVNETITIDWERQEPRVIWDHDVPIDESSCVNCGQCVTVCPCNALMEKAAERETGLLTNQEPGLLRSMIELTKKVEPGYGPLFAVSDTESKLREEHIDKTKTVCTYCGVGCSFNVWTKGRQILKVEPQAGSPANDISTCVKGKFGFDYVNSEERLTNPLIREGDYFREATWEEAISYAAKNLKRIRTEHGTDALGFIASSKATNEESFLMQKFARQVNGTNNIDNCSRYCQTPATIGLFRTVGYGGDAGSMSDLQEADLVITVGSNTAESHPVLASKIKRAQKLHGQTLMVFDLRKHEMARRADEFYQPKPGSDLVWLSAVTKYIIDNDLYDHRFVEQWVNQFKEYKESLEPFTLEYAERMTGITQEQLIYIANTIARADKVCVCWAMGVTQQQGGSDTSTAISNLLLATGNYGRPGTGAYPLRGHNNVQGCSDFGSMPNFLVGYDDVSDEAARERYEQLWGVSISHKKGKDNHEMVDSIHEGTLKGLYIVGEDTGIVDANINYVTDAFDKLEFLIVQDLFLTKTAEQADVVFPACSSLEKEGTFTNTERRIQRLYQSMEPLENSKPDWEILQLLANEMGYLWAYSHPSEIMEEAASLSPLFAGVTYERLEGYNSLQWPVRAGGIDTPRLYEDGFPFEDGKAKFYAVSYRVTHELTEEYDLHVNNGRLLEHFHEGNMTYKSAGITRKTPNSFLEVSKELAHERGIEEGALVRLTSEAGSALVEVHITDRVNGNQLYLPLNDNGKSAVNLLTNNDVDVDSNTPAYKEIAVNMTVIRDKGVSPLPNHNHRYGNPKPQVGVRVEDKWKRSDYTFPGEMVKSRG